VSGDDVGARGLVSKLIEEMGFYSLDLGSLAEGGRLQQTGAGHRGQPYVQ
jgi:predicted dinucleotide-binding enzyme